jgi:hypothetical protein
MQRKPTDKDQRCQELPFGRISDVNKRIRAEVSRGTSTTRVPSLVLRHYRNGDARLTNPGHYRTVEDRTKTEDEIKKAEQHEVLKQMLLRLLDDPQVQRKIVIFLSRRLGQIRGE